MEQSKQVNYFQIGSFMVAGITLLIAAFVVFGSGIFQRTIYAETYFNESVQGLAVGSPVKYLGMNIGKVKEIASVDSIYKVGQIANGEGHDRYIYVKMAISPKFFAGQSSGDIDAEIVKDVKAGLRVKLAMQGLTGNAYLELDFMKVKAHPGLTISWKPDNYYVPSTTSTLTYFSDNVQYLLEELKQVNLKKFFANMQKFVEAAQATAEKTSSILANTAPQITNSVNNLRTVTNNLAGLTTQARGFPSSVLFGKNPPKLDPGKL